MGLSYGKKSANVVMWKAKEYKYIRQVREINLNNKELRPFFARDMSAENNAEQSFTVWEQAS